MTFPHTATIQRKTKVGTKYTFAAAGSAKCFLQPLSDEESQFYGITFSQGYRCYVPLTADVLDGDRVTIDTANYSVKGCKSYTYGSLPHKRLALELLA